MATQAQQVFYVEDQVDPRWFILLSRPKIELFDIEGDDNIADNCMENHPFANRMPKIKFFFFMKLKIMMKFVCVLIVRGFGLNIKLIIYFYFFCAL